MCTFVPPPLHVPRSKLLADGVVAPYAADANQLKIWQKQQIKHQNALEHVEKLTDQSTPMTSIDTSLISAKERSRAFVADEVSRHIASENRRLIGNLSDIDQRPNAFSQMSKDRPKVPKRGVEAEKRRNKEIARENELLVKRLLSVKTSFNRKEDEKDYKRHRRDIERLGKIKGPPPPIRSVSSGTLRPLPPRSFGATPPLPLAASAPAAVVAAGAAVAGALHRSASLTSGPGPAAALDEAAMRRSRGPPSRTLPPLPKALQASRSSPSLTTHGSPDAASEPFSTAPTVGISHAATKGTSHERASRPSAGSLGVPVVPAAMASTSNSSVWRGSVYTIDSDGAADESRATATPDLTSAWLARVLAPPAPPAAAAVADGDVHSDAEGDAGGHADGDAEGDSDAAADGDACAADGADTTDDGASAEDPADAGADVSGEAELEAGDAVDTDVTPATPDESRSVNADAQGDGG